MIFFTCIISCFNREQTIERAIQSVLNQKYQNFEIIVVDDNSKDNSVKVVNSLENDKITLIKHNQNLGQNSALNTGVKNAKYDYIAFLDSDDIWLEDYLLEMVIVYENYPKIGFVYCSLIGSEMWYLEGENKYSEVLDQGFLSSMITITAKKDKIIEVGGFDIKYKICQDDDFCFRLAKTNSFKVIKKRLAQIIGADNSMTNNKIDVANGWVILFKNYKKEILLHCGSKTYSKHMLNISFQYLNVSCYKKAMLFYFKSVYYFFRIANNKFSFPKFYNYNISFILKLLKLRKN